MWMKVTDNLSINLMKKSKKVIGLINNSKEISIYFIFFHNGYKHKYN